MNLFRYRAYPNRFASPPQNHQPNTLTIHSPWTASQRTHVFKAPGLLESVEENGVQITRPIRITIAPEESGQILVERGPITSDVFTEGKPVIYRFYCPLHRADDDTGGTIIINH